MTETSLEITDLKAQYTAQVAADLERNDKEQDRLRGEIEALQGQLEALQQDHTVLLDMRKALGAATPASTASKPAPSAEDVVTPSVPRQKTAAKPKADKKAPAKKATAKKTTAPRGSKTAKDKANDKAKDASTATAAATEAAKPTLVELIRRHLNEQSEPRSAAEVATALGQAHPDRRIQTTVVRTTLEGLVAKSRAQRTKQGSSVFYTAADTRDAQDSTQSEPTVS
ncbi:hypothetical protein [Streptomyces spongiae]|uniref:Regulatory protein n=1 Tax=Streptomyces spongiae TaxID=565072 RepID=A0A5N8X9P7_9ACTN|nr:hypothetical protein [Streptomyces spongiae]MPY56220.1 hypothetical protein [Streptomyces spongiae]